MDEYEELTIRHTKELGDLSKRYNLISGVRMLFALAFAFNLYFYTQPGNTFLIIPLIILAVAFLLAVRVHQNVSWKKLLKNALLKINNDEARYLKENKIPFENGAEFINASHDYSYDLDFFGDHSFFQNLNRTSTRMGKHQLASTLLSFLPTEEIVASQEAIKELETKVDWRQEVMALGKIKPDNDESYSALKRWSRKRSSNVEKVVVIASYITSILLFASIFIYFYTPLEVFGNISFLLFLLNLVLLGTQIKKIKAEIIDSSEIDKILKHYSLILEKIEQEPFKTPKLESLQNQLQIGNLRASRKIEQLSGLFAKMDHVQNFLAGLINGFFPYHILTLDGLLKWREECRTHLFRWLEVIGKLEALNSLANFAHNNPSYVYPKLNDSKEISFKALGHPLITVETRINNDVTFNSHSFFILTGSNMSGKSTFLRTLGINMVLTAIGAPVCAAEANVHPLPVLVSMRLSDSLNESESYFFAEVKRLKRIMKSLENTSGFVLLDEILRGTNSDDKRSGTIAVIHNMVAKKAIGMIATHDLEVCNTVAEFPDILENKCFEVEIENNELVFDYKLREGICRNKSATFLMEKMGVI